MDFRKIFCSETVIDFSYSVEMEFNGKWTLHCFICLFTLKKSHSSVNISTGMMNSLMSKKFG